MKQTLLEIVQGILASMSSDEVESITDTTESDTVAKIVRDCYLDIVSERDYPEHRGLFNLTGSGDTANPTRMQIPSNVADVLSVKYDKATSGSDHDFIKIDWCEPEEFLHHIASRDATDSDVQHVETNGTTLLIRTDKFPELYTAFDDEYLYFDSIDLTYDTTLQSSKTQCWGVLIPTFSMDDSFTPDLDADQFARLRNEAKAQAFYELKQTPHARAERTARRQQIRGQHTSSRTEQLSALSRIPNYGRR